MATLFTATVTRADALKKLVDALAQFSSEVCVYADAEGLSIQAMDSAHVCLVALESDAQAAFEAFSCDAPLQLGLPLASLGRVLKLAAAEDRVTMSWAAAAPDQLRLQLEAPGARSCEFKLRLIEADGARLAVRAPGPDDDGYWRAGVPAADFAAACRDLASLGGDQITFVPGAGAAPGENGPLRLETRSEEIGQAFMTLPRVVRDPPADGAAPRPGFAARYMVSVSKAHALASTVELHMGDATPLMLQLDTALGRLQYFIAPRMVDEDDDEGVIAPGDGDDQD